jgi:hypothetical protein
MYKFFFWCALSFITIGITAFILHHVIPLEFADSSTGQVVSGAYYAGLCMSVFLAGAIKVKQSNGWGCLALFVLSAIIAGISLLYLIFMATFADGMCLWTTRKILFENKENPSSSIVVRDFGCGATDSSPATFATFQVKKLAFIFVSITPIDTSKIDRSKWRRYDEPIKKDK